VNIYAYRHAGPQELIELRAQGVDVVGPENDRHIATRSTTPNASSSRGVIRRELLVVGVAVVAVVAVLALSLWVSTSPVASSPGHVDRTLRLGEVRSGVAVAIVAASMAVVGVVVAVWPSRHVDADLRT
jgi:hypothetical protein